MNNLYTRGDGESNEVKQINNEMIEAVLIEMPDLDVDTIYHGLCRLSEPAKDDTVPHTQTEDVIVGEKGPTIGIVMEPNVQLVAIPPAEMTFDVTGLTVSLVGNLHRRGNVWRLGRHLPEFIWNMKKEFPDVDERYFLGMFQGYYPPSSVAEGSGIRPTPRTDDAFMPENRNVIIVD